MPHVRWDTQQYHGRYNKYPFTEVVSFVMRAYGSAPDRAQVRILDLGCGGAHHLLFLASEGFDYYGIDGSEESIHIATQRLGDNGFRTDTLACGTFEQLPYDEAFFDCVIDRGSLTCNRLEELPPLLAQVRRILKPGGRLFSLMLNDTSTLQQGATPLGRGDFTNLPGRLQRAGALHFTNAEEARGLFRDFTIEDIELIQRRSEHTPSGNRLVVAWTAITCRK
jgi:SAM-dependent methyltransferase